MKRKRRRKKRCEPRQAATHEGVHLKRQRTGISISEERGEWWQIVGEYLVQWDSKKAE